MSQARRLNDIIFSGVSDFEFLQGGFVEVRLGPAVSASRYLSNSLSDSAL